MLVPAGAVLLLHPALWHADGDNRAGAGGAAPRASVRVPSEKDAKLAQRLGQLQPFIAAFPQEYMGQLASFGPT